MSGAVEKKDRVGYTLARIGKLTEKNLEEFTSDALQLSRAILQDESEGTGQLAGSMRQTGGGLSHIILAPARSEQGKEYAGFQEWGYTSRGGRRVAGKKFLARGTYGMLSRWRKGGRWEADR